MKTLVRIFIAAFAICCAAVVPAKAQVFIVSTCGTVPSSQATLIAGNPGMMFIDQTGKLCVNDSSGGGGAADPCASSTKLGAPINLTASGQIITGAASKKTYICAIDVVTGTAQNIALVEGTGSTCATNIYGLAGGTTAATGWNFAANGGIARGAGTGTIYSPSGDTNATAANVCLLLSGTGQTSGQISYVQQ